MARSPDLVIFGAGIAGLWTFHALKKLGYDVLLLEREAIGGGQTIAAQGIIHSGLKFTLTGKISPLAARISQMPQIWRDCLKNNGPVDLSGAKVNAQSQLLMIPAGLTGNITKAIASRVFSKSIREISPQDWPENIRQSGFRGHLIAMDELVLDVPSVIQSLGNPYKSCIAKCTNEDPLNFLKNHHIEPKRILFTTAESNHKIAKDHSHDDGLQTQARPLLQVMIHNAPFPLYAHLIGTSEKPIATITTHTAKDGNLIWYLGGGVAERPKDSPPHESYHAACTALKKHMPNLDLSRVEWSTLPIDRIEGKSSTNHWMPDTPTIHRAGSCLYAWPTKLTFAPMLGNAILEDLQKSVISPSNSASDYSDFPNVDYAAAPWDTAVWTK